jgi:hypothetical protein
MWILPNACFLLVCCEQAGMQVGAAPDDVLWGPTMPGQSMVAFLQGEQLNKLTVSLPGNTQNIVYCRLPYEEFLKLPPEY